MIAKTKSERLRRLLSHGYFAPELPPCFISEDLAKYRKSIHDGIDALPPDNRGRPALHRFYSEHSWFYFPRYAKDDRRHGVPNPISYLALCKVVADNYVDLRTKAKKSGISASPPIFDWVGARALLRPSVDLRDDFRIDLSARREEFASADIRAFFHSIYTHAIPWSIYGKPWSKGNRGVQHYGNLIDLLCRNAQDGQTIGLPVGPDVSRLIAEVLASAIDVALCDKLKVTSRDVSRYIDDYTLSSVNGETGEDLIAALRQAVSQFELELNSEKSGVYSTATRQDTGWKQLVKATIPRWVRTPTEFQKFFYEVGRICDRHPDVNVEKYAYQNARLAFVRAHDWKPIQSYLINSYRRNSTLIDLLVEVLILRDVAQGDVDKGSISDFLRHRIPVLTKANRTGEIIWLLFLWLRLGIVLHSRDLKPLFQLENSMVALLIAAGRARQLVEGEVDFQFWNRSLNAAGLRSGMWLFAYESVGQGLNVNNDETFIQNDSFFSLLHSKKVRFLAIETGLVSVEATIRGLRGDNARRQRLRDDFADDFSFELDEFPDVDEDEDDDIVGVGY